MHKLSAGFLRPSAGQVLFDGEVVCGAGPDREVVFQGPTLFPWLTVAQKVAFILRNKALAGADIALLTEQWLQLARVMALEPKAARFAKIASAAFYCRQRKDESCGSFC